jgi:SAM-dependent methyltransferase
MVLHHADLDVLASAFARLLRPHGRLFVYDFDWDAYDDRAAGWLAEHDSSDADNSVAGWRHEHSGLHTGAVITQALEMCFEPVLEARRPYLARMLARHDLETVEHALTDARMLPALGFWVIAERRDVT